MIEVLCGTERGEMRAKGRTVQKFQVIIRETLERVITVEAEDRLSALRRVRAGYASEEIVLSADDFTAVEMTAEAASGGFSTGHD